MMCYNILLSNGEYIAHSTVILIPDKDLNIASLKTQMEPYTKKSHEEVGDHNKAIVKGETLSEDNIYYDASFNTTEDDDITWPWEKELEELPLAESSGGA